MKLSVKFLTNQVLPIAKLISTAGRLDGAVLGIILSSKSQAHVDKLLLEDGTDESIRVQGDGDEIWTPLEIAIYHDRH